MNSVRKIIVLIFITSLQGCYSFKGISIDSSWKTFNVGSFPMQTAGGPPNLSLVFTEKMREYFQRNTSLKINQKEPDLYFEGGISGYEMIPQAPTSGDRAGLNRLQIKVQVKLTNAKDDAKSYDQEFVFFEDFPQNQTLTAVERELYPKILDKIISDIFIRTAGDW
jgi:hypothetical protein